MKFLSNRRAMLLIGLLILALLVALNLNRLLGLVTRQLGISIDLEAGQPVTAVVPDGFETSIFASGLLGPRFMAAGPDGTIYVTEQSGARVTALRDADGDGKAEEKVTIM